MNNFTTNTYELKREICNFSEKIANGTSKPAKKFVMETQYGLAKGGSCLVSNMARALDEDIKLNYTIDRLCDNFANLDDEYEKIIWRNYINEVKKHINTKEPIAIFDDSDINKEYSKKLEDFYSKIYSCKSKNFKSKNTYTLDSIKAVENIVGKKFIGIFDRGYDDKKIFDYMDKKEHSFIVRLEDTRTLLFKGKKKSVEEVAKSRKGKIAMKVLFDDNEEYELMLSYTKATLPYNKKEYTLVIVYGLSEDKPMKLLTNIKIESKEDVIRIVRLYLSRWRIEEHFRGKKQEYDFENMRVRTLKSMNNLNMMLTIHLGHIAILADKIDSKLLIIKIIYASKSLRSKTIVWLSQIARGMKEILKYAHEGIKRWQDIEVRDPRQLSLKL